MERIQGNRYQTFSSFDQTSLCAFTVVIGMADGIRSNIDVFRVIISRTMLQQIITLIKIIMLR